MTATAILNPVKPCAKCGAVERCSLGKCKPCNRAAASAWYEKNRERAIENGQRYRAANPEKHKAAVAAVIAADPIKKILADAAWHARNRDRVKDRKRAWYALNPGAQVTYAQNRRARKISVGGRLTNGLRQKLNKLQNGKCACCKKNLGQSPHLDHHMPLALGGTNTDDNMQLLCKACNLQKHIKHPIDFMQSKGYLL